MTNDFFDPEDDEVPVLQPGRFKLGGSRTAADLLPQALVESEIGMDGIARIGKTEAFCLVVQAPTAEWVAPIHRYLRSLGEWDFHHSKSVPPKSRAQMDEAAIEQTMRALTCGGRCLGVSQQVTYLPPTMVSSADMHLVLPPPNARVVGAVIRAVTGKAPRKLEDSTIAMLDFDELATCIRPGTTEKACVDRLRAAAEKKSRHDQSIASAPLLKDLHGYGTAA